MDMRRIYTVLCSFGFDGYVACEGATEEEARLCAATPREAPFVQILKGTRFMPSGRAASCEVVYQR